MAQETATKQGEGLSLQTLVVAAVASAVAAIVVSHVWKDGTVLAAAMTPVLVSILKEALQRPMQSEVVRRSASRVSSVATAPARRVGSTVSGSRPSAPTRTHEPPPTSNGSGAGHDVVAAGPRRDYSTSGASGVSFLDKLERLRGRPLKIAIATGLLAFVVAAVVITVPELVFGGAVSSGHRTTIFGGGDAASKKDTSNKNDANGKSSTDKQSTDQGTTSTPTDTGTSSTPQQTTPTQTQTQTTPSQTPSQSSPPPSGGGTPAPQTPVPTPPSP